MCYTVDFSFNTHNNNKEFVAANSYTGLIQDLRGLPENLMKLQTLFTTHELTFIPD